jgi:hypothetical protein
LIIIAQILSDVIRRQVIGLSSFVDLDAVLAAAPSGTEALLVSPVLSPRRVTPPVSPL